MCVQEPTTPELATALQAGDEQGMSVSVTTHSLSTPTNEGIITRPLLVITTDSQRLFQARIKQPMHQEEQEKDTNPSHETFNSQDDTCFESLCELSDIDNVQMNDEGDEVQSQVDNTMQLEYSTSDTDMSISSLDEVEYHSLSQSLSDDVAVLPTITVATLPLVEATKDNSDEEWDCLLTQQSTDDFEPLANNESTFEVCDNDFEWT